MKNNLYNIKVTIYSISERTASRELSDLVDKEVLKSIATF